jgi:hypothetical protein
MYILLFAFQNTLHVLTKGRGPSAPAGLSPSGFLVRVRVRVLVLVLVGI